MGEASELKTAEEALGFQPSEQAWWIRTRAGKLWLCTPSPPPAPGQPDPAPLVLGLDLKPPVGCQGFPLSS